MIFNKGDFTLPASVTIADAERWGRICVSTSAKAFTGTASNTNSASASFSSGAAAR